MMHIKRNFEKDKLLFDWCSFYFIKLPCWTVSSFNVITDQVLKNSKIVLKRCMCIEEMVVTWYFTVYLILIGSIQSFFFILKEYLFF